MRTIVLHLTDEQLEALQQCLDSGECLEIGHRDDWTKIDVGATAKFHGHIAELWKMIGGPKAKNEITADGDGHLDRSGKDGSLE